MALSKSSCMNDLEQLRLKRKFNHITVHEITEKNATIFYELCQRIEEVGELGFTAGNYIMITNGESRMLNLYINSIEKDKESSFLNENGRKHQTQIMKQLRSIKNEINDFNDASTGNKRKGRKRTSNGQKKDTQSNISPYSDKQNLAQKCTIPQELTMYIAPKPVELIGLKWKDFQSLYKYKKQNNIDDQGIIMILLRLIHIGATDVDKCYGCLLHFNKDSPHAKFLVAHVIGHTLQEIAEAYVAHFRELNTPKTKYGSLHHALYHCGLVRTQNPKKNVHLESTRKYRIPFIFETAHYSASKTMEEVSRIMSSVYGKQHDTPRLDMESEDSSASQPSVAVNQTKTTKRKRCEDDVEKGEEGEEGDECKKRRLEMMESDDSSASQPILLQV